MPKRIFKYELSVGGREQWRLPFDASIFSVGQQNGTIVMWVMLDPDAPTVKRDFYIASTGQELPDDVATVGVFRGTVQMPSGLVWHVFEVPACK